MISLRYKKMDSGKYSVYLDYTAKGLDGKSKRHYEFLKIHVSKDYSHSKRIPEADKEMMELAQSIRSKRELELYGTVKGLDASPKKVNVSLIDFTKSEALKYNRKQHHHLAKHLVEFNKGKDVLFSDVNLAFIEDFGVYIKKRTIHNTMIHYLENLKAIMNRAVRQEIIASSIFSKYKMPPKQDTNRSYLELFEVQKMKDTETHFEPQIRQAFLFSCFTGLRLSDVISLKKEHIKIEKDKDGYPFHTLLIRPIKTTRTTGNLLKVTLSQQAVSTLNEVALDKKSELIFNLLPVKNTINSWLKKWAEQAGITKNLHFHMARHTFATLCLTSGVDIYTVSKLLGHTRIDATQIYAKIIEEKKLKEVKKFPVFTPNKPNLT